MAKWKIKKQAQKMNIILITKYNEKRQNTLMEMVNGCFVLWGERKHELPREMKHKQHTFSKKWKFSVTTSL